MSNCILFRLDVVLTAVQSGSTWLSPSFDVQGGNTKVEKQHILGQANYTKEAD